MDTSLKNKKVALVHDFLHWYGGAEKVFEAFIKTFPEADIYVGYIHPKFINHIQKSNSCIKDVLQSDRLHTTFVNKLPFLSKLSPIYQLFLPFAFENIDFSGYDIVISDSTNYAKGVITNSNTQHLSYIHTPPRFLWGLKTSRQEKAPIYIKPFLHIINHFLRIWDYNAAQRPNKLIANAKEVEKRILKFYKRKSSIINPPIDLPKLEKSEGRAENTYLFIGRLVKYKRVDLIIETFKKNPNYKLIIGGKGSELENLKSLAKDVPNIKFLGYVSDEKKWELLSKVNAFVHIHKEDFGITTVEALAAGTPVIGLNEGGTAEIIENNKTGILIEKASIQALDKALKKCKDKMWDREYIRKQAQKYTYSNFKKSILQSLYKYA